MTTVFEEFLDGNLHWSYPLTDDSGGEDNTGAFSIPSALISDIYMCVPNLSYVDKTKFYISNILIRRYFIDIEISYDDPAVTRPLGVFKNISTTAAVHSSYDFIPTETQSNDQWTPMYHMTGQIIIGDAAQAIQYIGSWSFDQSTTGRSSKIVSTRISKGLLNVQYISINGRLFTGNVRLREGSNIQMQTDQRVVNGVPETVVTISASLNAASSLQLANDEDVLAALTSLYGRPMKTINGMSPNSSRNFTFIGQDCTTVESIDHGLVINNPCAAPCCDSDENITNLMASVSNLNLRYSQLKAFFDGVSGSINTVQNKLLVLGTEV